MTIYRELHDLLLVSQRRVRQARENLRAPLSSVEAIILGYIHQDSSIAAGDIAQILGIAKASMSELLSDLEKKHCITTSINSENRRKKSIAFTPRGQHLLRELEDIQAKVREIAFGMLNNKELDEYRDFLRTLANGLGARTLSPLPRQDPLGIEQRRIMQVMGLISQNYMGTGYELHEYQIMIEIGLKGPWVSFQQLNEELPFHPSRISRSIQRLEKKNILQRQTPKEDKRMLLIAFTPYGADHFEEIEQKIEDRFELALNSLTPRELEKAKSYIERIIIGENMPNEASQFVFKPCEDKALRYKARAFLIEQLVKQNLHLNIEAEVLPEANLCFLALLDSRIEGIIEIQTKKDTADFEFKYCFYTSALKQGYDDVQFVREALKAFHSISPTANITITSGILVPSLLAKLSPLRKKTGKIVIMANDL